MVKKEKWQEEIEGILRRGSANTDISKALNFLLDKVQEDNELLPTSAWSYHFEALFALVLYQQPVKRALQMAFLIGAAWGKYRAELLSEKDEA